MSISTTLLIVVFCLVMEAFFSGSEIAFISVSRFKLSHLVEKRKKAALLLNEQFKFPSRLYGTTSLGTNIFVFSGTAVMTAYLSGFIPGKADIWAVIIMAPVTLLFGEIFPKAFCQRFADRVSYVVIYPLLFAQKIFLPILWIFTGIARLLLGRSGEEEELGIQSISQEEIRRLFSMGQKGFDLHPDEMKIINRIFDFRKTTVEQCMTPLINISAIEQNEPINSIRMRLHKTKYSRLPVYADKTFNIVGIVCAFDVLRYFKNDAKARDIVRPALYIFRKKKIGNLLPEMQKAGVQMAVVVNEYSGAIGIVTREDLIEEIFGEIEDEYDETPSSITLIDPGHWLMDADVEVDLINETYGLGIPQGDYETIAGYILSNLERIPAKGETIRLGGFNFIVKEGTDMGLEKLEVFKHKGKDENK